MSTVISRGKCCACTVVLIMLVSGSDHEALCQVNESGAEAKTAVAPMEWDDAFIPTDVADGPSHGLVDVRDTATDEEPADTRVALWEQLANLSHEQRDNAAIELELAGTATRADHEAAASIAARWNGGDQELAILQLRILERSGASLGLGIAWKVPLATSDKLLDNRIGGTRTEAQTMSLDFDAQNGHLFAVIRWGSTTGTSAWTVNLSDDSGVTWSETYTFSSSTGIIDVDCAVADDYVYVAYVAGNATDEARIRRCLVSTGGIDGAFGFHVVFDAGANTIEEVALASNADDFDNRVFYAAIQSNDVLRYAYDVASDGTTFEEQSPPASNPEFGLDMTWDNHRGGCGQYLFLSYAGNDGNIHVLGRSDSNWTDWTVETGSGSSRRTAVSAYENATICAFEYPYTYGTGIRYRISYNCGLTWSSGSIAVPDGSSVFGYFEPDIDARNGDGLAIIYQAEAGEFDPMYYRTRPGFAPGAWSDPVILSDYDVYTGSETTISYLPPLSGELFSHGAIYLSLDPDFRTPYFDRPAASGPACGDTTPPTVSIDSPDTLACSCDSVEITGSVDDPDGTYGRDRLQIRRQGTTDWIEVDTGIGARSGLLYTWNATGMPQDYYYIRVVAENECGLTNSDSTFVYKPTAFDTLQLDAPEHAGVYGGTVCLDGTAWAQSCFAQYTVSYRLSGDVAWQQVDPLVSVYSSPVVNGRLASWDTIALNLVDEAYELRVIGETECGNTADAVIKVIVDNAPPVARLDAPENCGVFAPSTEIAIYGEASDTNLDSWTLAVIGGPYDDWHTCAGPTTTNANGLLFTWDTTGLPDCVYTFRLRASDESWLDCGTAGHVAEDYKTVVLGGLASPDLDEDGDVDIFDYLLFQLAFTGPLP
ncbi:MAG: hypothetical protein J5J06_11020 [Phycisphaerae bacterium]|nr:hypothetical protein [Phycisphaerae bacterium]